MVKQRTKFTKVRERLQETPGVSYRLVYPAGLMVKYENVIILFMDLNEVQNYAAQHFGHPLLAITL